MDDFDALVDEFASLEVAARADELHLNAILVPGRSSDHLACTGKGTPCFLVACNELTQRPSLELRYIAVAFSVLCTVETRRGSTRRGTFVMIECRDGYPDIQGYFIRVVAAAIRSLAENPSASDVSGMVTRLAQLFMTVDGPTAGSITGLWAELFVIAASPRPRTMLEAWREAPSDPYDFNAPPQCLEVKATLSEVRKHHFSLRQLVASGDTTEIGVASFLMRASHTGVTVRDLMDRVRNGARLDAAEWLRLEEKIAETLGQRWHDALDVGFDEGYARERLAFYRTDNIPQVREDPEVGVSEVRFASDLSFSSKVDPKRSFGGFLRWLPNVGGLARDA